ncbi:MAG: SUMF1/EgtB/PvdO family nonheme iron enzyme [Flavobacteriales bacterium]|jgi:formylglycine-generating enzyme|nr:SUMF1/EgtB/PvdO family nonheme iron enzyme [Flavobacteriales bacterium]
MKKSLYSLLLLVGLAGCYSGPRGELVGVYPREEWIQVNPYGMNYIHYGSFTMGPSDQDVPYALNSKSKTVTIPAFYIDIHEISNNEYRQFVYYVRDSLMLDALAQNDNEDYFFAESPETGKELDRFIDKGYVLNWEQEIDWEDEDIFDLLYDEFFLQGNDRFYNRHQLDSRKLKYRYWWIDFESAARKDGKDEELGEMNSLNQLHSVKGHSDRSQFIIEENINIYPDTLVWVHDFTYGFNEPLTETYFWHPAYDDYPVVGVTWGQTKAFNAWRTQILNDWKHKNGESFVQRFRMPSEAEWEYAARGGLELAPYPWGGPYTRNIQGCPLANFKPMRGDYVEDAGCYTVPIESYSANDYGLFQMAGNVAEWTNTAYDESVYDFTHDMSSEYQYHAKADDAPSLKRKVIRGGSWKDIGYFIQTGTRSYEYQDTAKSYIGFRSVMSYLGRGKNVSPEDFN